MNKSICKYGHVFIYLFLFIGMPLTGISQNDNYEEITVKLMVKQVGTIEIPAIYMDKNVYLPVSELFDYLKVKNDPSSDFNSISGFFINPKDEFQIDKTNNRITYKGKAYDLMPDDLIKTTTDIYLKSAYYNQVFGLQCKFDFRSLTVLLTPSFDLPVLKQRALEQMHRNIKVLENEKSADTTIKRNPVLLGIGMADWSIASTQQTNGEIATVAGVTLGGTIAGGEAMASINYNTQQRLAQQIYRWRYVNNDLSALRQVVIGNLAPQNIASVYAPIIGIQLTNAPTYSKRSLGTYKLSDRTEPGWIVELYVNNVLINYVKADESGLYSFDVPLIYGSTHVTLHFYGPWGEEQTKEQSIIIPYNFLATHQFEYSLSNGIVEDTLKSIYSHLAVNYGVSRSMTIGGGVEYLSSIATNKVIPFVNTSFRIGSGIMFSEEYANGVRSKSALNFKLFSVGQMELNYVKYVKGQTAIRYNYQEEKKVMITIPVRSRKFSGVSRFTYNQVIMPKSKLTNSELMLSTVIKGVGANLTTSTLSYGSGTTYVYNDLMLTFRLPFNICLMPQMQYDYKTHQIRDYRCEAQRRFFNHAYLNISYENNAISKIKSVMAGFRYDFSFAQAMASSRRSNKTTMTSQTLSGSIIFNGKTGHIEADKQSNMGRGGILITPFLDLNCNGKKDEGEPKVYGLNVKVAGGRMVVNEKDTSIKITGLEAYSNCYIETNGNRFENIAWILRKKTFSVTVEPNYIKPVEVPVSVAGQVSGMVQFKEGINIKGLGRVTVEFYDRNSKLVGSTVTEPDGYFSYLGLDTGSYTVQVSSSQLDKLHLHASTASKFDIKASKDGDMVDGLNIMLQRAK